MPASPRHWFQFHLTTAVLVVITLGGMIPLELHERKSTTETISDPITIRMREELSERGFPWTCWSKSDVKLDLLVGFAPPEPAGKFDVTFLALDAAVMLAALSAVAFASEAILSRGRSSRVPSQLINFLYP